MRPSSARRRGFTLIELLIVIAIIAVLASLLLAVVVAARRMAAQYAAIDDLQAIKKALQSYRTDFQRYPPDDRLYVQGCVANDEAFGEISLGGVPANERGSLVLGNALCRPIGIGMREIQAGKVIPERVVGPLITPAESRRGTQNFAATLTARSSGATGAVNLGIITIKSRLGGKYLYRRLQEISMNRPNTAYDPDAKPGDPTYDPAWATFNRLTTNPRPDDFLVIDPGSDLEIGGSFQTNQLAVETDYDGYLTFIPDVSKKDADNITSRQR